MSSITAAGNTNYGMESLSLAMTKRANDQHGQAAMQLLQGAVQSAQQVQAQAPAASNSRLGANVDIRA